MLEAGDVGLLAGVIARIRLEFAQLERAIEGHQVRAVDGVEQDRMGHASATIPQRCVTTWIENDEFTMTSPQSGSDIVWSYPLWPLRRDPSLFLTPSTRSSARSARARRRSTLLPRCVAH